MCLFKKCLLFLPQPSAFFHHFTLRHFGQNSCRPTIPIQVFPHSFGMFLDEQIVSRQWSFFLWREILVGSQSLTITSSAITSGEGFTTRLWWIDFDQSTLASPAALALNIHAPAVSLDYSVTRRTCLLRKALVRVRLVATVGKDVHPWSCGYEIRTHAYL